MCLRSQLLSISGLKVRSCRQDCALPGSRSLWAGPPCTGGSLRLTLCGLSCCAHEAVRSQGLAGAPGFSRILDGPGHRGQRGLAETFVFAEKRSEPDGQEERKASGVKSADLGCLPRGCGRPRLSWLPPVPGNSGRRGSTVGGGGMGGLHFINGCS